MPITSTDILFKLSTLLGSAGNTTASTPDASLGKYVSTTQVSGTALNNIFDNISGEENAASEAEYRCIFVHNSHATLTLLNAVVYMTSDVAGGANVALSVDTTAASAVGSSTAQAKQIVDENSAPVSQTFVDTPVSRATGLALGNIGPGQVRAVWIRRTATNSVAQANDGFTLNVDGETEA